MYLYMLNKELTLTICRRLATTMTIVILRASSRFSLFANSTSIVKYVWDILRHTSKPLYVTGQQEIQNMPSLCHVSGSESLTSTLYSSYISKEFRPRGCVTPPLPQDYTAGIWQSLGPTIPLLSFGRRLQFSISSKALPMRSVHQALSNFIP